MSYLYTHLFIFFHLLNPLMFLAPVMVMLSFFEPSNRVSIIEPLHGTQPHRHDWQSILQLAHEFVEKTYLLKSPE